MAPRCCGPARPPRRPRSPPSRWTARWPRSCPSAGSWQKRYRPAACAPEMLALMALEVSTMSAVSIRNLDDRVKERLRVRAARHGRSMEAEMRAILTDAVSEPEDEGGLLIELAARFEQLGGVDLEIPPRVTRPRAADFDR